MQFNRTNVWTQQTGKGSVAAAAAARHCSFIRRSCYERGEKKIGKRIPDHDGCFILWSAGIFRRSNANGPSPLVNEAAATAFMDVGCNTLVYIYLFRPPKKFFQTFMGCLPEAWDVDIVLQRIWVTVREAHLLFVWDQTQMCRWSWVSCRWFQWAAGD